MLNSTFAPTKNRGYATTYSLILGAVARHSPGAVMVYGVYYEYGLISTPQLRRAESRTPRVLYLAGR